MKTRFFSRPDAGRLRKAGILFLIAIVVIAGSIAGRFLSGENSLFAITYLAGFILFFYSLLHPWFKAGYYATCILVFVVLLILIIKDPGVFLKMVNAGNLPGHGAEDLAWAIGGVFFAGIIAGIIGLIRTLMYRYDDD